MARSRRDRTEFGYGSFVHGVSTFPQAVPVSRASTAYTAIMRMISERQLLPGSLVTEAELVRELGFSRTPVREALHRLEAEGHLISGPGRGYRIAEVSEDDLIKVYRVRSVLEATAAYDACAVISHAELGRLRDLYDSMEKMRAKKDDEGLAQLNSQFHRAISVASGNQYLDMMLGSIYVVFDHFRPTALVQPGRRDQAAIEHGQIIELLAKGERDAVRDLAEQHVMNALRTRQRSLEGDGSRA